MAASIETVDTDVLVLGGGLAGYRAANAARRSGAKVVIAYQAKGASQHIIGFNVPREGADSPDSIEAYARDTIEGGYGINDRRLVEVMAGNAAAALRDLIEIGVPLQFDGGVIARRHLSGNTFARSVYHPNGIGRLAVSRLVELSDEQGIQKLAGWKAISLLQHASSVVGALLCRRDGTRMVAVRAASTVLAMGGVGAIYGNSTYPPDITADSYAFALDSGATLIDMEFVQFEPTVIVEPGPCCGMEMPTAMFADGATLRNRLGQRFMLEHNPGHGEMQIEKAKIALAIQSEVSAGRAEKEGTVLFDTSNIPPSRLESYIAHCKRLRLAGIDPGRGPIWVKPAAHSHMGGIRIDANCHTGIQGLYAAGEASGGVHGASRIAGNGGSDAIIFGGIAGAAAASGRRKLSGLPWAGIVASAMEKLTSLPDRADGPRPEDIKNAVRQTMLDHAGIVRTERDLLSALEDLRILHDELRAGLCLDKPADRVKALEAISFIMAAKAVSRSCLERTESRGAHWRDDYPIRDDRNWMCHVSVRKTQTGELEIGRCGIE
ncbi:FAD-binding protein [Pollutimonas sp. H1-120]|uniref:FAD-binding protein n=1 Tax=Pollutimonas sp. H1-120 TaxID=3148824 RepID=UPI003B52C0F9